MTARVLRGALLGIAIAVAVAFLVVPVVTIVLSGVSGGYFLQFPPHDFELSSYRALFADPEWTAALRNSAVLAVSVAVVSVALGLLLAVGLDAARARHSRPLLQLLALAPLVVPVIVLATADYDLQPSVRLYGVVAVVVGQATLALPYSWLVLRAGLARVDRGLLDAALTLGDSRLGAEVRVRLPLLAPHLVLAGTLSAVISLTEPLMPIFLGSGDYETLARRTLEGLQHGVSQQDVAAATLLLLAALLGSALIGLLWGLLRRRRRLRGGLPADRRWPLARVSWPGDERANV